MIKKSLSLLLLITTAGIWAGSIASAPNRIEQALVEAYPEVYGVSKDSKDATNIQMIKKDIARGLYNIKTMSEPKPTALRNLDHLAELVITMSNLKQRYILERFDWDWGSVFFDHCDLALKCKTGDEFYTALAGLGGTYNKNFHLRLVLPPMQDPKPPSYDLPPKDQRGMVITTDDEAFNLAWTNHFLQMYAYLPYWNKGKFKDFINQNFEGKAENFCRAFDLADVQMIMHYFKTFDQFKAYFDLHGIKPQGWYWRYECLRDASSRNKSQIPELQEIIKGMEHLHFPMYPDGHFTSKFFQQHGISWYVPDDRMMRTPDGQLVWKNAAEFFGYADKCKDISAPGKNISIEVLTKHSTNPELTDWRADMASIEAQDAPPKKPEDPAYDAYIAKITQDFNHRKEQRKQVIDQQVSAIVGEMKTKGIPEDNLEYFARRLADFVPAMEGYGANPRHNRDDFRKRLKEKGATTDLMDKFEDMIMTPFLNESDLKDYLASDKKYRDFIHSIGSFTPAPEGKIRRLWKLFRDWKKFTKDFDSEKSPEMKSNPARWYSRFPELRKETIDAWIEVGTNPEIIRLEDVVDGKPNEGREDAADEKPSAEDLKLVKQILLEQYSKVRAQMEKEGIEPDMTKHFARKLAFYCAAQSDQNRKKFVVEAKRYLKEDEKATEEVLNNFELAVRYPFIPEAYLGEYEGIVVREGRKNKELEKALSEWKKFVAAVQDEIKTNGIESDKLKIYVTNDDDPNQKRKRASEERMESWCKRFPKIERDTIKWWIQCQKGQAHASGIANGYLACVINDMLREQNVSFENIVAYQCEKLALLCMNHNPANRDIVARECEKLLEARGASNSALQDFRFRLIYPKQATEMSREDFKTFIEGRTEYWTSPLGFGYPKKDAVSTTPTEDLAKDTPPFIAQKISDAISMIAPEFAEKTALPALSAVIDIIEAPFIWAYKSISDGFSWLKSSIFG